MRKRQDDDDYPEERLVRRHQDLGDDPAMRLLLPVGLTGWAIAAGYLGLISVLCFPAPFALLTGIMAIRAMHQDPRKHGMGRAIFGIVMGSMGTVGLVIILIVLVANGLKLIN